LLAAIYHYVKPVKLSKFPRLKALKVEKFEEKLNFIMKNYEVVDVDFFLSLIESEQKPQKNEALLTFDDGFSNHYKFFFLY
jgi:hypothetical protein